MTLMTRIDYVASQPDRAGRRLVRFSDGSSMRLYRQTVEDFSLYPGQELSQTQMNELRTAAGAMSAKMRAVRIVAASSVSKGDLEQRLIQKGEDPLQARDAVEWMADLSLIDDHRTAEQIVHRCVSKGYGLARAKQALYEKRIPKEYWPDVLADYPDQTEHIVAFLRTRLEDSYGEKEVRRAIDALLRKGHNFGQIRAALEQLNMDSEKFPEE